MSPSRNFIKNLPVIGKISTKLYQLIRSNKFPGSKQYWEKRYSLGGHSGAGSYSALAEFKAEIINEFVKEKEIVSIIEFGSGDGNQLLLAEYPKYTGFDVSQTAIQLCSEKFKNDPSKKFQIYDSLSFKSDGKYRADLTMSLDVIYHLIEDEIFEKYMKHLFECSTRFVIIYASNYDKVTALHVRDRAFTSWIEKNIQGWDLLKKIKNKYQYNPKDPDNTSPSDFFIYKKAGVV